MAEAWRWAEDLENLKIERFEDCSTQAAQQRIFKSSNFQIFQIFKSSILIGQVQKKCYLCLMQFVSFLGEVEF
jgi:hypothetical protein